MKEVTSLINKKEIIKDLFMKRIDEGKSLKYSIFKNEDASLLNKVEKTFGSISKCAEYCNISKEELISKYGMTNRVKNKSLTEEEIIDRLNYLKSINKLTTNAMRTEFNDLKLEHAIKSKYGSVKEGLLKLGYTKNTRSISYDEAKLILYELYNKGFDLSYKSINHNHSDVYRCIRKKLNLDWQNCLKYLNIEYKITKKSKYSKEDITEILKVILEKEGNISYSILRKKYSGVLSYVRRNYDNIIDFYLDFNYDPNECMDMNTQKYMGFQFEKIFKEILDSLNIKYEYNKYINNNKLRPDFILEDGTIIDCKLSSWSDTIVSTYDKYKNFTNLVIIVYLRGKDEYVNINDSNFKIMNVNHYIDLLNDEDKSNALQKLNNILKFKNIKNP